jgi:hypothetical protein
LACWHATCAPLQHAVRACAQVQLPHTARSLIERLLCNVEDRLGSHGGAAEVKVPPFLPA